MERLKLTQQKHTFTNQKKCTTTQNKQKKRKSGLVTSDDIWPENRGNILISELYTFVPHLLT